MKKNIKVGIDVVDIKRFFVFEKKRSSPFLKKVFTEEELAYCFSFSGPAIHLAGFFAMKEATSKALGVTKYPYVEIVVSHNEDGSPCVFHNKKRLDVAVSISHTDTVATAIAIA
jgi:holo-[acyl-carrier protein] synthase